MVSLAAKKTAAGTESDPAETRFGMVKERHRQTLAKAVAEKKVDEKVKDFLDKVNKTKNFFSSSSCSGRILLLALPGKATKREAYFVKRFHGQAKFSAFWQEIEGFKKKEGLWLKVEPFIIHLGCQDLKHAGQILKAMRLAGVKRGGILLTKPGKFLVELQGTEGMALPIKDKGELLVEKGYLKFLLKLGNQKLERNFKALKRFEKEFLKIAG